MLILRRSLENELKGEQSGVKERYITKYLASLFGTENDKMMARCILNSTFSGVKVYDLIEQDVYELVKSGGFTEEELTVIANRILENVPEVCFYLDIMRYDTKTRAKLIDFHLRCFHQKLDVLRDII